MIIQFGVKDEFLEHQVIRFSESYRTRLNQIAIKIFMIYIAVMR